MDGPEFVHMGKQGLDPLRLGLEAVKAQQGIKPDQPSARLVQTLGLDRKLPPALAVEAVRIFNERNIDDIVVVNELREPIGLIDSQDLPRLKLM